VNYGEEYIKVLSKGEGCSVYNKASFTKRLLATIIDMVAIITIFALIFSLELSVLSGIYTNFYFGSPEYFVLITNLMIYTGISIIIIYFAAFESSNWQGGIGKKILRLKIVNEKGDRLTLEKALIRAILKFISIFLYFTYISIIFTKSKTTFYDQMLGLSVIDASEC